jgi:hypothetical protein
MQNYQSRGDVNVDHHTVPQKNMQLTLSGNQLHMSSQKHTITNADGRGALPGSLCLAQDGFGRPLNSLHNADMDKCTVQVGGTRCSINQALQLGLLTQQANGEIRPTVEMDEMNKSHFEKPERYEVSMVEDPDHVSTLREFQSRIGSTNLTAMLAQAANGIAHGTDTSSMIADFAQMSGADPDTIGPWLESYFGDIVSTGLAHVAHETGADPAELMEFVTSLPASRRAQLLMSAHMGDRSAYRWLADQWRDGFRKRAPKKAEVAEDEGTEG